MAQQLGSNYYNSPYKFNGKELDEETGLYYYGARYYSPRESIWLSVDPLTEEFPDVSPYCYTLDNPINLIDPDGKAPTDIIIFGANKSSITIKTNLVDISVNASSLGVDFVGNYSLSGGDIIQAAVDIAGVFDPTPTSDILGAKLSADSGDWWGATASVLGAALPYAGDIAKGPKIAKGLDKISDAIKAVNGNSKASEKAQHIYGLINKETGLIEKVGISGGKITKDGEKSYRATKQLKELNKNGEKYTQKILDNVPAGKGAREKALSLEKKYTNANRASINPKLHNRPKPE